MLVRYRYFLAIRVQVSGEDNLTSEIFKTCLLTR